MKRYFSYLVICRFLLLFILIGAQLPNPGLAAPDGGTQEEFKQWLERYSAYDALERSLATESDSPVIKIKRARALLRMGEARGAITLLGDRVFEDQALERDRLWLLGRAQRRLGNLPEAVFQFTRAAAGMTPEQRREYFAEEPQLSGVWRDVWRKWFWRYDATPAGTERQAQQAVLNTSLEQALAAWPDDASWAAIRRTWNAVLQKDAPPALPEGTSLLAVTATDRRIIAKALTAMAIGSWETSFQMLESLSDPYLAGFWRKFLTTIRRSAASNSATLDVTPFVKASTFLTAILPGAVDTAEDKWLVPEPGVPSWDNFRERLAALSPPESLSLITRELDSALLAPDTALALRQMAFAFAVLAEQTELALEQLNRLDPATTPVSFAFAAYLLAHAENTGDSFPAPAGDRFLTRGISGAAGLTNASVVRAPFWLLAEDNGLDAAVLTWPLDELLLLGYLEREWTQTPSPELARRIGFLYPETALGIRSLLYLADTSGQAGEYGLSSFYLSKLDPQTLGPSFRADYLQAKARLEIELGSNDKALETYGELLNIDPSRLPPVKKLKLALLAQRKGRLEWAQEILGGLWKDRENLDSQLQAETLFWMAEGHQAMGNLKQALDTYLRLAWGYPGENIWAVTAMYRSALIYESQGKYQTAKNFLSRVLELSDRESQKKAAQDRIDAINSRLGPSEEGKEEKKTPPLAYPF